jgi:hypothetical protein
MTSLPPQDPARPRAESRGACCGIRRGPPRNQYQTNPTRQASLLDTQWFRNHPAVVDGWQSWWRGRRCADELLEHANMEHIMKSGTLGQFQANGDIVDDLDDAVGSHKSGLQLPRGRPR